MLTSNIKIMKEQAKKVLDIITLSEKRRNKKLLQVNPTVSASRDALQSSIIEVHSYSNDNYSYTNNIELPELEKICGKQSIDWVNIDIVNDATVNKIAAIFKIHPLIIEDILSTNQRPKMDEIDNQIFCVMQMMYYNNVEHTIESEQISIVLGKDFVLTFQDDASRDHFDPIRDKLKLVLNKYKNNTADYMLHSILDSIVDNYYIVMENLGIAIENLEENISKGNTDAYSMNKINNLRKEMILYRRNVIPAKDVIKSLVFIDNPLISPVNKKYFKDVLDHAEQAVDLSDNYKDIVGNIRDLYINQINLKTNEAMKFLTIITALLAPATVIGGIFGMNFEKLPYIHSSYGFFFAASLMIIIPVVMLYYFKKKDWY
jgi:magnesium transporter